LTVRDNVAYGLKIRRRPKSEIKEKVDHLYGDTPKSVAVCGRSPATGAIECRSLHWRRDAIR
jgi:hypothetical protein